MERCRLPQWGLLRSPGCQKVFLYFKFSCYILRTFINSGVTASLQCGRAKDGLRGLVLEQCVLRRREINSRLVVIDRGGTRCRLATIDLVTRRTTGHVDHPCRLLRSDDDDDRRSRLRSYAMLRR